MMKFIILQRKGLDYKIGLDKPNNLCYNNCREANGINEFSS